MRSCTTDKDFLYGSISKSEFLFLYHVSIFDDVQLQVLFDETRLVKEIRFTGDGSRKAEHVPPCGPSASAAPYPASSRSRIAPTTSRMPLISSQLTFSRKNTTEARKVNTSSIWPTART